MANIFTRSPYIVTINVAGQVETKIELRLWNSTNTSAIPTAPQYVLSKLIPATNAPATYYDISPYIREYINHNSIQTTPAVNQNTTITQYCQIQIRKFRRIGNTFAEVGSAELHKGFEGFGYYTDLSNPSLTEVLLSPMTYYYSGTTDIGWITVSNSNNTFMRYTSPSGSVYNLTISGLSNRVSNFPRVYTGFIGVGNKVELIDSVGAVAWTGYFYPKTKCKYTPVRVDFVNKFGAWQREWFFGASYDTLNTESTEYNLLPDAFPNYSVIEGQTHLMNVNGKQTIRLNSDWVDEDFKEVIKQMMLSEKILVNGTAAKLNTKSMDLQKELNSRMINYQLEFEYAYDIINSVI
jgi:hypothetical protein